MASCISCKAIALLVPIDRFNLASFKPILIHMKPNQSRFCNVRASMVDSYESSPDFIKRIEQAWSISQDCAEYETMVSKGCNIAACDVFGHDTGGGDGGYCRFQNECSNQDQRFVIHVKQRDMSNAKWCGGTGFFIIGDNMLCQVPSRSTTCVICSGKGSCLCSDCKGTGFRTKWLAV